MGLSWSRNDRLGGAPSPHELSPSLACASSTCWSSLSHIPLKSFCKFVLHSSTYINVSPAVLGLEGQNSEWVNVEYSFQNPSNDDWIRVFFPAPLLCTAPI